MNRLTIFIFSIISIFITYKLFLFLIKTIKSHIEIKKSIKKDYAEFKIIQEAFYRSLDAIDKEDKFFTKKTIYIYENYLNNPLVQRFENKETVKFDGRRLCKDFSNPYVKLNVLKQIDGCSEIDRAYQDSTNYKKNQAKKINTDSKIENF